MGVKLKCIQSYWNYVIATPISDKCNNVFCLWNGPAYKYSKKLYRVGSWLCRQILKVTSHSKYFVKHWGYFYSVKLIFKPFSLKINSIFNSANFDCKHLIIEEILDSVNLYLKTFFQQIIREWLNCVNLILNIFFQEKKLGYF